MDPSMHNEMRQLQLERLQSTINRAYRNVQFYQNQPTRFHPDPPVVESLDALNELPLTDRKQLARNYPYGMFAVPLRDVVRIHTAPGSGAHPTVSGYTRHDLKMWREIVSTALTAAEVTAHDILQIALDPGLANWARDYKDGAEAIGAGVIPNTVLSLSKQVQILKDYRTSVLITTPATAMQLAGYVAQIGYQPSIFSLKNIILVGEQVENEQRRLVEENLQAQTWLHYGLTEVPGPAIGFECEYHNGLHVNEDHFFPEIVRSHQGENDSQDAGYDELVLTTLTTRAFPLVRFRTGEQACFADELCQCGRPLRKIFRLSQRADNLVSISGVKVHRELIEFHIVNALNFLPRYRYCISHGNDGGGYLELWIEVDETFFSDEIKVLESQINAIDDRLREDLGIPVAIRLKEKISFK